MKVFLENFSKEDELKITETIADVELVDNNATLKYNHPLYIMPPYNNNEGVERLSQAQFGI